MSKTKTIDYTESVFHLIKCQDCEMNFLFDKVIKIGEVFFIDAQNLRTWGINSSCTYEVFGCCNSAFDIKQMLLAVKYLGNGIIQEMTTGEFFMLEGTILKVEDKEIVDFADHYRPFVDPNVAFLNYKDISKLFNELRSYKDVINKYPITYCGNNGGIYYVNDSTKKAYLCNSNDERKQMILSLKKQALDTISKLNDILDSSMAKTIDIIESQMNDYNLEVAYLENDLYDFEKNGRIK